MLETNENTQGALGWLDSYTDASLLCINDDVQDDQTEASPMFRAWQERHWGRPAAWEHIQ